MNKYIHNAIKAEIETAYQVKVKFGYVDTACIYVKKLSQRSKKVTVGFSFLKNVAIGDIVTNDDGSVIKIVALV